MLVVERMPQGAAMLIYSSTALIDDSGNAVLVLCIGGMLCELNYMYTLRDVLALNDPVRPASICRMSVRNANVMLATTL